MLTVPTTPRIHPLASRHPAGWTGVCPRLAGSRRFSALEGGSTTKVLIGAANRSHPGARPASKSP